MSGIVVYICLRNQLTKPRIFTASHRKALAQRYLIHPGAILRFFVPQGRHVTPIRVKFGVEESTPNFTPITAGMGAWGPKNFKIFPIFFKILEYKRPVQTHPSHDFYEINRAYGHLTDRQCVKI